MKRKTSEYYVKYFMRNKIYFILASIQFLVLIACLSFFSSLHFTGFRLLYLLSRWNFYFSAVFAVVSYYICSAAINAGCAETIDAIYKKRFSWQNGIGSIHIFVLSGYHLIAIIGLIYCSLKNDGTNYFLAILPRTYLINVLIPQVILVGLSYIASCISEKSKIYANSFFVAMLIMTSPLLEQLIWREKPNGVPIDRVVDKIKGLFAIFYQNSVWSPDTQYGLQTEDVRLYLQLFWLLLIFAFLIWTYKNNGWKKIISPFCFGAAVVMGVMAHGPASVYRLDESWNGIFADFIYYEEDGIDILNEEETDYYISKYDLDVDIKNQLLVSGKLSLQSKIPRDEFVLTLYHGYKVKELKAEGIEVIYEQNEDRITMKFPEKISNCNLTIQYEGDSGKYYSNSQAVLLPGYFPWYPMAGQKQVFVQYPYYNGGNGYNPYNRISEAEFELKIHLSCDFVTNLEEKGDNLFIGKSDSVSIIGGNIVKTDHDSFVNYLPLELNGISEQQYLEKIEQNWNQTIYEINDVFGIDTDTLKSKKMIMVSKDMGRNFWNNYFVEFDHYILFSSDYLDSATYINYLLQKSGKESEIGDLFSAAVLLTDKMSAEAIIETMISEEAERQQLLSEIDGDATDRNVSDQLEMLKNQLGTDKLLREIVQYLLNPEIKTDNDFWDLLLNS